MYAIADIVGVGTFEPPRPVLGLQTEARVRVAEAVDALRTAVNL